MEIDLGIIKSLIDDQCKVVGNEKLTFKGIQSVYEAVDSELTWIKPLSESRESLINSTKANGIICDEETFNHFKGNTGAKLFIVTKSPKLVFVSIVKFINGKNSKRKLPLIHPTAIIDPDCKLGEHVEIGAYSVIGACHIGDNTIIREYVKVHDPVTIGKNCLIREFCTIGGAGFGYSLNEDNQNEHIPHIGSVLIEDNVDIYPYSNVDRGTLGKTIIRERTVIDHYVHIGHNTVTGKNNIIAAGTVLAGGSRIMDNCFIGVQTVLKEKCKIGSNVITGMGTVVVKNIPDNEIWVGNPGRFLKSNK